MTLATQASRRKMFLRLARVMTWTQKRYCSQMNSWRGERKFHTLGTLGLKLPKTSPSVSYKRLLYETVSYISDWIGLKSCNWCLLQNQNPNCSNSKRIFIVHIECKVKQNAPNKNWDKSNNIPKIYLTRSVSFWCITKLFHVIILLRK